MNGYGYYSAWEFDYTSYLYGQNVVSPDDQKIGGVDVKILAKLLGIIFILSMVV